MAWVTAYIAFTPELGPKGLRAVGVRCALKRPAHRPGIAGDSCCHSNTSRRQDRNLNAISLAGGSRADRGRGPLDDSLQFRNARAAIGTGAKRSPDIGDVCRTPFSHSAADGFKSDTVTGADDRPGFGNALGALAGKKKTPAALGQNSRIKQRAHDFPSRRIL
jgi:hypothetical protein